MRYTGYSQTHAARQPPYRALSYSTLVLDSTRMQRSSTGGESCTATWRQAAELTLRLVDDRSRSQTSGVHFQGMSLDIRPSLRLHQASFDFSAANQGPDAKPGLIRNSAHALAPLNVRRQPRRPLRTSATIDRPSLLASVLLPLRPRRFDATWRTQARASEPQSLHRAPHPIACPNIHLSTYRTTALPPVKLKVGRPIEDIHLHAHQRLGSGLMIGDAQAQAQVQITAPLELPRAKRLAQAATYVHVRRGWGWIHDPLHRSSWAVGQRSGSRA